MFSSHFCRTHPNPHSTSSVCLCCYSCHFCSIFLVISHSHPDDYVLTPDIKPKTKWKATEDKREQWFNLCVSSRHLVKNVTHTHAYLFIDYIMSPAVMFQSNVGSIIVELAYLWLDWNLMKCFNEQTLCDSLWRAKLNLHKCVHAQNICAAQSVLCFWAQWGHSLLMWGAPSQ